MFSPRFTITGKVLASIIDLEKANQIISLAPLQTDWEKKIKQDCLSRRAFSVLRYLGNDLSVDDVAKIVKDEPGRDDKPAQVALRSGIVAKEKDVQRMINWLNTDKLVEQTAYLTNKFKQGAFEEKDLESINSLLGERIRTTAYLEKYREDKPVEMVDLKAPAVVEVPYQMEDLFGWYKGIGKSDWHPLLKAGVMLWEIVRIRPFVDDNVTTALFFFDLIMDCEGLGIKKMVTFEEEILKNRQRWEEVLRITTEGGDLTAWFEFLSKEVADAAEKTKVKILNLVGEGPIFKTETGKAISLTERQIAIMEEMTIQSEMSIKEIRAILPMVSDDTILRDLKDLMTKKLIKKKGKTKGAVYVVGKVKGFK